MVSSLPSCLTSDPVLREFVQKQYPALIAKFSPDHVIVFGSRVRGESRRFSDLDVIIVSQVFKGMMFANAFAWVLKELDYPDELEPLCYTPEQFERLSGSPLSLVATACREGIWLERVLPVRPSQQPT